MNYRHGYHAGNFADVVKHIALVRILLHLRRKDAPFAVVDSHAGRGLYDLAGEQAGKTGEAKGGIARLMDMAGDLPESLAAYLALVKGSGGYPGSPLIAAKLLRPQDRLTAIEKHPEEAALLKQALAPFRNATVEQADGYARAAKLLPPPARRGLVLMDPPFEAAEEFAALAQAARTAHRKFATGLYLLWYPVKSAGDADRFLGEVIGGGADKAVRLDPARAPRPGGGQLAPAGPPVPRPPSGFCGGKGAPGGPVAPPPGPERPAEIGLDWLAGAE